jgi:hypothetical protein
VKKSIYRGKTNTATVTLYRKLETFIPRNERGLVSSFHIYVSVIDLYIPRIGPRHADRSWECINRSKTHESGNLETEH